MHEQSPGFPLSVGAPPADPLAEPVRALLAAGRWRKARDAAKLLCKRDRARYLSLLIEANLGLARELATRKLGAEAEQVLAYLKTIAPPEVLAGLDVELACLRGDKEALRVRALRLLAESGSGETTRERVRLADDAVLAFNPVSAEEGTEQSLAAELQAVHRALEAVCTGGFEQALELVRPLARDSAFSHWVRWVKGVIAFYRGDRTRAARCFAELPVDSVPARAAAGYRLLMTEPDPDGERPGDGELAAACHLLGRPSLAGALAKADALWREGKPDNAYDCLRRTIPEFPRTGPDPIGALSDFCFNSVDSMAERQGDRMLHLLERLGLHHKARSDSELALSLKAICLQEGRFMPSKILEDKWTEYLKLLNRLHGPDPLRDSLGYAWLGEHLGEHLDWEDESANPFSFFERDPDPKAKKRAVAALTRAAELDPSNVEPQLKLCELHAKLGQSSERNRLLDEMTARFPDRKEVLLLAGSGCIERQAFKKGIDYLERARELDPIDPRIPLQLAVGRIERAVDQYRARRLESARETWAGLDELVLETPNDLTRSRWAVLARQGMLECCFGDPVLGESRLAEARAASPSAEAFLFHTHFVQSVYAPKQRGTWLDEFVAYSRNGARVAHARLLVSIFHYWKHLLKTHSNNEEVKLHEYIRQAVRTPFTRDEAARLLFSMPPSSEWNRALKPMITKVLAQDPKDPPFRLFQQLHAHAPTDAADYQRILNELQSIVEEAHQRRDDDIAKAAQSQIRDLKRRWAHLTDFQDFGDDPDSDDEDEIWDPFPGPKAAEGPDPASLDFNGAAACKDIIEMIANASPGQIKELKRNPPPGIPREILDSFIRAARGGDWNPPLPLPDNPRSTARGKGTSNPTGPPDQCELPF
jgi:tetratricopeptide (TPR) repeat protein